MADEVVVIYHGEVMEAGTADDIFRRPEHPYLRALMKAVPHFDMKPGERLVALRSEREDLTSLAQANAAATHVNPPGVPLLKVRNLRKVYKVQEPELDQAALRAGRRGRQTSASTSCAASASASSVKAAAARRPSRR